VKPAVILDAGPLVALLDRRDTFHAWVKARFAEIAPRLLTCEALLVGILALTVATQTAWAGQTRFNAERIGERLQLDYSWVDSTGNHSLTVQLDGSAIEAARRGFRAYRLSDLQSQADAELERQVAQATADLERAHPGLRIELDADLTLIPRWEPPAHGQANQHALAKARVGREIQAAMAAIKDRMRAFELEYLRERLYEPDGRGGILPSYARIARDALPGLAPLAQALRAQVRGLPKRDALSRALAFVQTIPYDPLNDRAKDPGLLPPLVMLADNRGDCDTKSVAFAALAHLLYPQVPSTLVLVPHHALLALGLEPRPGDRVIHSLGRDWVLTEPVGPATPPVGEIGVDSPAAQNRSADVVPLFP
jgi:hypothetical protein